jgi:hypothetical protein
MPLSLKLLLWNKVIVIRRRKPTIAHDFSTQALVSASLPISTIASTPLHIGSTNADTSGRAICVTTCAARGDSGWHNKPSTSRAQEHAITALTIALPIFGVVPIAGAPMKTAVGGLLEILKVVDVSWQMPSFS